jgi:N-acetylmuramoyl-L-alanine amidase
MRKIAMLAVAIAVVTSTVSSQTAVTYAAPVNGKATKVAVGSTEKKSTKKTEAPKPVMVTVAEGDSLSSIAERNSSTWVRLYNANEAVQHPDIINPGQELRVPGADEQLVDRALPQPPTPAPVVAAPVQTSYQAPAAPSTSYPVDANSAKATIYARESGNNPNATNPGGCYGIGQDCNGVVRGQCGADYACQDSYFTNYMARRYGSWEAALAFWNANGWW